jgi:hypothetical protein
MKKINKLNYSVFILTTISVLMLASAQLDAQSHGQVYRWTDAAGNPIYSSTQPDASVKPADLPPIMREKMSGTPLQLTASCTTHGGISCEKGADADGSVICADDFRDASARFQFRCAVTKLSLAELAPVTPEGELKVWVRNERDIQAEGVEISVTSPGGERMKAEGPAEIAASELAEYTFRGVKDVSEISKEKMVIACANCG